MNFPHGIKEICEMFDVTVLADITEHPVTRKAKEVYYIGSPSELSAGLYGFQLSQAFFSKKQLEKYCRSKKGKEEMNKVASETFYDWDVEKCCWKSEQ